MRWLWHEWKDEAKPWIGFGNPCTTQDKEIFATTIKVTIGDGKRASFWETPWLDGRRPMDIAPLDRNGKNCTIYKALEEEFWISQFNTHNGLSLDHIVQFANLREMLQTIHLDPQH
jgi:hypothetical protein